MSNIIQNKFHQVIGDGARLSKFIFVLYSPVGLQADPEIITYSIKSCALPTVSHEPINIMHKGRPIPVRGTVKYNQSFDVTFYSHENHIVKDYFETWLTRIEQRHYYYDPYERRPSGRADLMTDGTSGGGISDGGPDDFLTFYNQRAQIIQKNFDGDYDTAVYTIFNVFPTAVSGLSYDHSARGSIGEFTVTFSYSHYTLTPWETNPDKFVASLINEYDFAGGLDLNTRDTGGQYGFGPGNNFSLTHGARGERPWLKGEQNI